MVSSMTAFAREVMQTNIGLLTVEMRSLNYRYLDVNMVMPENWDQFIDEGCQVVKHFLKRGRAECRVLFQPDQEDSTFEVNRHLVGQLTEAVEAMASVYPHAQGINAWDVLSWPGVLQSKSLVLDEVRDDVMSLIRSVVKSLVKVRRREGKALGEAIKLRLEDFLTEVTAIKRRMPWVLRKQREKLYAKLSAVKSGFDPMRLEQEMIVFAQRMDVSEEIERLEVHVKEVLHVLEEGGAMGRRLDFMMQELNREANTLASKSVDAKISHAAVQLKVSIEQMREQVQNIE